MLSTARIVVDNKHAKHFRETLQSRREYEIYAQYIISGTTNEPAVEYHYSYRIHHSIDHYTTHYSLKMKDRMTYQNVIAAVDLHRKALTLVSITYRCRISCDSPNILKMTSHTVKTARDLCSTTFSRCLPCSIFLPKVRLIFGNQFYVRFLHNDCAQCYIFEFQSGASKYPKIPSYFVFHFDGVRYAIFDKQYRVPAAPSNIDAKTCKRIDYIGNIGLRALHNHVFGTSLRAKAHRSQQPVFLQYVSIKILIRRRKLPPDQLSRGIEKISAKYFFSSLCRYNTRWYTVPVRIQKLFLFIMQNTTKAYVLNIGNLIMASVEGFTKVRILARTLYDVRLVRTLYAPAKELRLPTTEDSSTQIPFAAYEHVDIVLHGDVFSTTVEQTRLNYL